VRDSDETDSVPLHTSYPMGTPLDVPIKEKDVVKALGAKWAYRLRRWYVPADVPLEPFRRWLTWRNECRGPVSLEPFTAPADDMAKLVSEIKRLRRALALVWRPINGETPVGDDGAHAGT
jgi:hypothetical protein